MDSSIEKLDLHTTTISTLFSHVTSLKVCSGELFLLKIKIHFVDIQLIIVVCCFTGRCGFLVELEFMLGLRLELGLETRVSFLSKATFRCLNVD